MGERRDSKKRETRQRISDVATTLFFDRGFDAVTLDEIAAEAGVSKMTVLNYFARKEDLMLDREDDLQLAPFREALRARPAGEAPVATLRHVVDALRAAGHPIVRFDGNIVAWWRVVAASPALQARLREHADAAADALADALDGAAADGVAHLAAGLVVLTVRTARAAALRVVERGGSAKKADAAFADVVDHGLRAVDALLAAPAKTSAQPSSTPARAPSKAPSTPSPRAKRSR